MYHILLWQKTNPGETIDSVWLHPHLPGLNQQFSIASWTPNSKDLKRVLRLQDSKRFIIIISPFQIFRNQPSTINLNSLSRCNPPNVWNWSCLRFKGLQRSAAFTQGSGHTGTKLIFPGSYASGLYRWTTKWWLVFTGNTLALTLKCRVGYNYQLPSGPEIWIEIKVVKFSFAGRLNLKLKFPMAND